MKKVSCILNTIFNLIKYGRHQEVSKTVSDSMTVDSVNKHRAFSNVKWRYFFLIPALVLLSELTFSFNNDYTYSISTYPYSEATLNVECHNGDGSFSLFGSAPANEPIPFSFDQEYGDTLSCRSWTTLGPEESGRTEVVSFTVPFPKLPVPENPVLSRNVPGG